MEWKKDIVSQIESIPKVANHQSQNEEGENNKKEEGEEDEGEY